MPASDHYATEAAQLETEIARKGAVLGIDWNDTAAVRTLARRALASHGDTLELDHPPSSPKGIAMLELLGLAQLILKLMRDGNDEGITLQGGPVWQGLSRVLWEEARQNTGAHKC